jgi:hypothetical protein
MLSPGRLDSRLGGSGDCETAGPVRIIARQGSRAATSRTARAMDAARVEAAPTAGHPEPGR